MRQQIQNPEQLVRFLENRGGDWQEVIFTFAQEHLNLKRGERTEYDVLVRSDGRKARFGESNGKLLFNWATRSKPNFEPNDQVIYESGEFVKALLGFANSGKYYA